MSQVYNEEGHAEESFGKEAVTPQGKHPLSAHIEESGLTRPAQL
jgi:hypothetical protein